MARLGIERYNSNYSKYLNPLLEANMIDIQDARMISLGYIYYLTKKGFITLSAIESLPDSIISYPKRKPSLDSNVFHRTYAIDCQIELEMSCQTSGDQILFYEKDIDNSDIKNVRKTRISLSTKSHIEPDAIFMLRTNYGDKLYCFEFEHKDSFQKSMDKIEKYIYATNHKSVSKKYNHPKGHRTLFVYHDEKLMNRIMDKAASLYKDLGTWFLFKSYGEVIPHTTLTKSQFSFQKRKDFMSNWQTINRRACKLY